MERGKILDEAKAIINGPRQDQHGNPENNFQRIASLWNDYLGDVTLTEQDVCIMMTLLKIARITTGSAKRDSFIDACGYLALAYDFENKEDNHGA